ncbi:hypothetical protein ALC56_08495 [Trachymyrmex septentrionalis]|uniref:Uncharacterized protein n=1 Tax=Trachymyrmex septentrionalis TaxID=34720 RepID=A0A195F9H9_9HYME|nr:hypothetical protein ALC56_08495 [Trachymyrmex septentrionalis]
MRLLSDVERLMAARMAVRSEARGSGEATTKVREGLHVLVQARWSATLQVPFVKRDRQKAMIINSYYTNQEEYINRHYSNLYSTYTKIFYFSDATLRGITHLSPDVDDAVNLFSLSRKSQIATDTISQHLNKSYAPFSCKSAQNELDFYEKFNKQREKYVNQNIFLFHKQSLLRNNY